MNCTQYSVGTTPVKIFDGTGKITIDGSGVKIGGDSGVTWSTGAPKYSIVYEFCAPTEVWAVANSGTQTVTVLHWY